MTPRNTRSSRMRGHRASHYPPKTRFSATFAPIPAPDPSLTVMPLPLPLPTSPIPESAPHMTRLFPMGLGSSGAESSRRVYMLQVPLSLQRIPRDRHFFLFLQSCHYLVVSIPKMASNTPLERPDWPSHKLETKIDHLESDPHTAAVPMPTEISSMSEEDRRELERQLVRKIDARLMPAVIIMYLLNYIDRNNIASARLGGLEEDLNLKGSEYQTSKSILHSPSVSAAWRKELTVYSGVDLVRRVYPHASPEQPPPPQNRPTIDLSPGRHGSLGPGVNCDSRSNELPRSSGLPVLPRFRRSAVLPRMPLLPEYVVYTKGTGFPHGSSILWVDHCWCVLGSDCCRYHRRDGRDARAAGMEVALHH